MSTDEVGPHVAKLVGHVKRTTSKGKPTMRIEDVLLELCLRTRVHPRHAASSRSIQASSWFQEMKSRYSAAVKSAISSSAREETTEVVGSMYGNGCNWSELASTLVTIVSMMMEVKISDAVLTSEATKISEAKVAAGGPQRATKQEVEDTLLSILASTNLPQDRWWEKDAYADACKPQVEKLALRSDPAKIHIQYTFGDKKGFRQFKVSKYLSTEGSVTSLSKKLHRSGHAFFSEAEWAQHLMRLQRVMKQAEQVEAEAGELVSAASNHHFNPAHPEESNPPVHPQVAKKADIGLLYRDPEAALKDVDLQDADDVTVKEYKLKMDDAFNANIVRPGDPGYKYDIRVEAKPTGKSEWDDSDSD